MRRWLPDRGASVLMRALGVPRMRWCGLWLPRRELFDEGEDGDVDIVGGPLEWAIDEKEQKRRVEEERERSNDLHEGWVQKFASDRAAAEGCLRWPPDIGNLVACEAKASWYDVENGTVKRSHAGAAGEFKGQIMKLLKYGVDRVAALHIISTKPHVRDGENPWFKAGRDLDRASRDVQVIYEPGELPDAGYFRVLLGAVPAATEDYAGAGGDLEVVQASIPSSLASSIVPWRLRLKERLARLPVPRWPCPFVLPCPRCSAWTPCGTPQFGVCHSCDCVWRDVPDRLVIHPWKGWAR